MGLTNTLNLDVEMEDGAELVDFADDELTIEDLMVLEALQHLERKKRK